MRNAFHILGFRLWLLPLEQLIAMITQTKIFQRKGNGESKVERKSFKK